MRISTFDYPFDESLVANEPVSPRDSARLLVLRDDGATSHLRVSDLPSLLPKKCVIVANDTRVLAARLLGRKEGSGGKVEVFLLELVKNEESSEVWKALGRASKGFKEGAVVHFEGSEAALSGLVLAVHDDGTLSVRLTTHGHGSILDAIRRIGRVPLPPYIRRAADDADRDRYQTVFAKGEREEAVAAPTAGLHFTPDLLRELTAEGRVLTSVTLHVGLGTFQPVTVEDLDAHPMHEERFEVSEETARIVNEAKATGTPVVAIGTTVVRALESATNEAGALAPGPGRTRLLIQPGHTFRMPDLLLTNFHLPKSTLLALVCAFGGTARVLSAYEEAVRERYRFFSYGDAMLLWRAR